MVETGRGAGPWVLERSLCLRMSMLFILYAGQGMLAGLTLFAIPAWVSRAGAGPVEIATVAACAALPWSLKVLGAFVTERYAFLPMGRGRVWLLSAQVATIIGLIAAALANPAPADIALLAAIGFSLNLAAAVHDVVADGLAVDILAEDEHARGASLIFGGQALGTAAASMAAVVVIEGQGVPAAFLATAALLLLPAGFVLAVREREGERLLPWTRGRATARSRALRIAAWRPLLAATVAAVTTPLSLLWLPVTFARGLYRGGMLGVTLLIGTSVAGQDAVTISSLIASAGLIGGMLGMMLGDWLGDRFGTKRSAVFWLALQLAALAAMVMARGLWSDPALFAAFVVGWIVLDLMASIATLPIAMRLCEPCVAATQFAIYTTLNTIGTVAGAVALAEADLIGGLDGGILMNAGAVTVALLLIMTVPYPRRNAVAHVRREPAPGGGGSPLVRLPRGAA